MTTPTLVATTTAGSAAGTTLVINTPAGVVAGDVLVAFLRAQGTSSGTTVMSASGWTAVHVQSPSDRGHMILTRVATGSEPASTTFATNATSGRIVGAVQSWRNVDAVNPIAGTRAYTSLAGTTTQTLTAWTVDSSTDDLIVLNLFSDERTSGQSHVPTTTPPGYATNVNVQSTLDASTASSRTSIWSGSTPSTGTTTIDAATLVMPTGVTAPRGSAVALRGVPSTSRIAEGTVTVSGAATASQAGAPLAANGAVSLSGVSATAAVTTVTGGIAITGSASATYARPGFSSVSQFLSTPGATAAWRLGGGPYPQHSEYAGDQSVVLGYGVLEFSIGWTSDLVPFGLGTQYLDSIAGVTGSVDPTTMTWATLSSTYVNKNNPVSPGVFQPFYKLQDALAKYTPTHVMIVDPKYGFDTAAKIDVMLDLCDANGGPSKILIKFDSPTGSTNLTTRAHARGYQCINYWGTDTTTMAVQQANWDALGVLYSASAGVFAAAKSHGKKVWGAVVPDQAGYNNAVSNGADFVNVSGVTSVTPVSAGPTGTGTLTLSGAAVAVKREIRNAQSSLVVGGSAGSAGATTATPTVTISGTAIASAGEILPIAVTALGALNLSGHAQAGVGKPFADNLTLTARTDTFTLEATAPTLTLEATW